MFGATELALDESFLLVAQIMQIPAWHRLGIEIELLVDGRNLRCFKLCVRYRSCATPEQWGCQGLSSRGVDSHTFEGMTGSNFSNLVTYTTKPYYAVEVTPTAPTA